MNGSNKRPPLEDECKEALATMKYWMSLGNTAMAEQSQQIYAMLVQQRSLLLSSTVSLQEELVDDALIRFWNILANPNTRIDPQTNFLCFAEATPLFGREELGAHVFVRPAYISLGDLIFGTDLKSEYGVLITGCPGIGKSLYAVYLLFRLIRENAEWKSIIYDNRNTVEMIHIQRLASSTDSGHGTHTYRLTKTTPQQSVDVLRNSKNFYIFDAAGSHTHPILCTARTIVLASPNRKSYKHWAKERTRYRYMPTWTWEEIHHVWYHLHSKRLSEAYVQQQFATFGGVPRYVYDGNQSALQKRLTHAINECKLSDIYTHCNMLDTLNADTSHMVVHYQLNAEFEAIRLVFATKEIQRMAIEKCKMDDQHTYLQFLRNAGKMPMLQSLRGSMFEDYVLMMLPKGGAFQQRSVGQLVVTNRATRIRSMQPPTSPVFNMTSSNSHMFRNTAELTSVAQTENLFLIPWASNFKTVDAMIKMGSTLYAFQMTVSKRHDINYDALVTYQVALQCTSLVLMIVLPPEEYVTFRMEDHGGEDLKSTVTGLLPIYAMELPIKSWSV